MNTQLAKSLIRTLPSKRSGLFNPWTECCEFDTEHNGPEQRLVRLAQHLDCEPQLVAIGEAPGYQGCRYSGIAFASERQLLASAIPRVDLPAGRLTTRRLSFSEPSATTVWKQLKLHGLEDKTVLWNAVQLHPHTDAGPWTNRTPTKAELAEGRAAIQLLREAFPGATLVAIGGKAYELLKELGITPDAAVRHPSRGGAPAFGKGMADLLGARHAI